MKVSEFTKLMEERFHYCTNILVGCKDKEYSRNGEKLHNFKRAGELLGVTPEEALLGMWSKQLVSLMDIARDVKEGRLPSRELLTEKVGDVINYAVLLEALITERISKQIEGEGGE